MTALHRLIGILEDYAARLREARAFSIAIDIASEATDGMLKPWLLEAFEQDVALIAPCKEHAFAMVLSEVGPEGAYSESLGRSIVPTDFRKLSPEYAALMEELMNEKGDVVMQTAKIKRALAMLEQLGIGHGTPESPAEEFLVAIEAQNELMSLVASIADLQSKNRILREMQTEAHKRRMEESQKNTTRVKDVIQYIYDNGHHKDCPKTQDIDDNNDCDCGYDDAMSQLKALL
jgi:hypothetical protein